RLRVGLHGGKPEPHPDRRILRGSQGVRVRARDAPARPTSAITGRIPVNRAMAIKPSEVPRRLRWSIILSAGTSCSGLRSKAALVVSTPANFLAVPSGAPNGPLRVRAPGPARQRGTG